MAPGSYPRRIVETWPGRGTGDTYYRTDDGRLWHTYRGGYLGTGNGPVHDVVAGCMVPRPEPTPVRAPKPREPNRHERRAALSPRKRNGRRRH